MKKTILMALLSLLFAACHTSELENAVKELNTLCPKNYGDAGVWTGVKYEDGNVVMYFDVNETYMDVTALNNMSKEEQDMLKANALTQFSNDPRIKHLLELMAEDNAGMSVVYTGMNSGDQYRLVFSRLDITDANKKGGNDPVAVLEAWIKTVNMQFPIEFDEGMKYTKMSYDGECVVYSVECDESMYDMAELRENKQILEDYLLELISDDSFWLPDEKNKLKAVNAGIKYKFYGNQSNTSVSVTISPDNF